MNTWQRIAELLSDKGYHEKVFISKPFQDPVLAGGYESTGVNRGQQRDFRIPISGGRGIHVRDFGEYYQAHIDLVDPSRSLLGHAVVDMPILPVLGYIILRSRIF